MSKDGTVKIADFGVAVKMGDVAEAMNPESDFLKGSPYWIAPELIEMSSGTAACDVWSLGCTIVSNALLSLPFHGQLI